MVSQGYKQARIYVYVRRGLLYPYPWGIYTVQYTDRIERTVEYAGSRIRVRTGPVCSVGTRRTDTWCHMPAQCKVQLPELGVGRSLWA